jgi:hypothetical protein
MAAMPALPNRLRHALRFATATLVCLYAAGVLWELLDLFVLDSGGSEGWALFAFNERHWRVVAATIAVVVFLVKLGDLTSVPPSWSFAWMAGLWLSVAIVLVVIAIEERQPWIGLGVAAAAVAGWYAVRTRVPGRPPAPLVRPGGAARDDATTASTPFRSPGERDLR